MSIDFYDRKKLYQEVWAESVTVVAKRYGVSDVAIKKACKKLKVPTPGRGYWQQVKAGAEFRRPPLPKFDAPLIQHIGNSPDQVKFREDQESMKAKIPIKKPSSITVPEKLLHPHPLLAEAAEAFKKNRPGEREQNPVRHFGGKHLDIYVAKNSVDRAFRIMDTVLKALTSEGYTFRYDERQHNSGVVIEGELLFFRLREHINQVPHIKTAEEIAALKRNEWSHVPVYDHIPTGELKLSIEYYPYLPRKSWADGKKHQVEEYIAEFIAGIKMAAAHAKIETERRREEKIRQLEAEERWRIAEKRRDAELEKFTELEKRASDWQRAQTLIQYVDALEASLAVTLSDAEAKEKSGYIAWAREKIDWLNRLVGRKDEWLGYRKAGG